MYKFKMKFLYNEEKFFYTKTELLDLITLPLVKLDMVGSRLVSNGLIFSGDIPIHTKLVNFLLLSNVSELSLGTKTKSLRLPLLFVKYILPNKKSYLFSDICTTFF